MENNSIYRKGLPATLNEDQKGAAWNTALLLAKEEILPIDLALLLVRSNPEGNKNHPSIGGLRVCLLNMGIEELKSLDDDSRPEALILSKILFLHLVERGVLSP